MTVNMIHVAQYRMKWRAVVNKVKKHQFFTQDSILWSSVVLRLNSFRFELEDEY
jgi:hypothetical protein